MKNIPQKTKRKLLLKYQFNNLPLWGHIQIRVRKRLDEFWKFFREKLDFKQTEQIPADSINSLQFHYENLIVKQVYSMAIQEGLYKEINKGKQKKILIDDDELDNLIELCFDLPELLTSMLFRGNRKTTKELRHIILDQKNDILRLEGTLLASSIEFRKAESKDKVENIISIVKSNLKDRGMKATQVAVSSILKIANSTFRDKLKKWDINFYKL